MARVLGIDGWTETEPIVADGCCALTFDIDPCALMCTMVGLLPSGPLWDRPKREAMKRFWNTEAYFRDCGDICPTCPDSCGSIVDYAVYLGRVLHDAISDILIPVLREADPSTSINSTSTWLEKMNWSTCFGPHCKDNRIPYTPADYISEYCVGGVCASDCRAPTVAPELTAAVEQALVESLRRLTMGTRRNLAGMNWVLAPLHAELSADLETYNGHCDPVSTRENCCDKPFFCLSPTDDVLPYRYLEAGKTAIGVVKSWYLYDCNVGPIVRPTLIAAHCLALAMLWDDRCDDTPPIRWCNCGA